MDFGEAKCMGFLRGLFFVAAEAMVYGVRWLA